MHIKSTFQVFRCENLDSHCQISSISTKFFKLEELNHIPNQVFSLTIQMWARFMHHYVILSVLPWRSYNFSDVYSRATKLARPLAKVVTHCMLELG